MERLRVVEGVEIITVIDNYIDVFLPDREGVKRRSLWSGGEIAPPLLAEHGLCFLVTVHDRGKTHSILLDSGFSAVGCMHNLDAMELSVEDVEAVVLSHAHFDHLGSLLEFYKTGRLRRGTPLHLHPMAFAERGIKTASGKEFGMAPLSRERLEEVGAQVVAIDGVSLIADGCCLVTGEVPRKSFEIGFPIGWRKEGGEIRRDDIPDDQSLIFHVKGKGLVVVLGCGHSGVINILNYAREMSGCDDIYLVIGGFHLTGEIFEKYTERTIDALIEMKPRMVVPTHCTGFKSTARIAERMDESFVLNSVGTAFRVFG